MRIGHEQLILCVSEWTFLPLVLPATSAKLLPRRIPGAMFDVLKKLGIPLSAIGREMYEMLVAAVGRTENRSLRCVLEQTVRKNVQ